MQVPGRVVKEHLFVGLSSFGHVFDIVVADAQIEDVAARKCLTFIPVVDVFGAAEDVTDCVTREDLGLDSVVKRF